MGGPCVLPAGQVECLSQTDGALVDEHEEQFEQDGADAGTGDAGTGVGQRLLSERERQGLSRQDIRDRTKIPERHLISIEEGDLASLPGRTYAIGFVRSYARELQLDEEAMVEQARAELGAAAPPPPPRSVQHMEPGDPARIPSAKLAWGVLALLLVIAVLGFFFWRSWFLPAAELPPLTDETQNAPAAAGAATPGGAATPAATQAPRGPVVFTATIDGVWVRFYDGSGDRLYESLMNQGDSFTIPADAENPQIWTGRPDALSITIGGRDVPPLAEEDRVIRDVPVSAGALGARGPGPGLPSAPGSQDTTR
ncbi:helix-turn-helix domain-containing protein [Croceicoccus sp. YJ47]|nr:helix-turn-helix domain-containing protein [Croceicoccus sp. YJ47]